MPTMHKSHILQNTTAKVYITPSSVIQTHVMDDTLLSIHCQSNAAKLLMLSWLSEFSFTAIRQKSLDRGSAGSQGLHLRK
jgi:hypothetical protein